MNTKKIRSRSRRSLARIETPLAIPRDSTVRNPFNGSGTYAQEPSVAERRGERRCRDRAETWPPTGLDGRLSHSTLCSPALSRRTCS